MNTFARTLAGIMFVLCAGSAHAQLAAERLYYGFGQRVHVTVTAPASAGEALRLRLYDPTNGQVAAETSCAAGRVDLAGLFPRLWTTTEPRLFYAQLMVGTQPFGAPLVLDPRVTPDKARMIDPGTLEPTLEPGRGIPMFEGVRSQADGAGTPARTFSALRVYPERDVEVVTSLGTMRFRLRPDAAPNTAFNFRHLVEGGFYDGVTFHRVVNELDTGARFVVQMGDPSGTGLGGPGYHIDLEPTTLPHGFGVLSMARSPGDPNSAGSQVFVCLSRAGTGGLDGSYTSFAELIDGAETLDAIARVETDDLDRPLDAPVIERASLVPAVPFPERGPSLREQPRIVPGR